MDIKEQKQSLRKLIRKTKTEYSLEEKQKLSKPIFDKVEIMQEFKDAKTVLLYWSMNDEVDTHEFVNKWYKDKTILLPCVEGADLVLRKYLGVDSMKAGKQFGILEPTGKEFLDYKKIDLMIIPGVAFDRQRNRMGRGR